MISTYLDDLKDGHLHDLFFCAVLHGLKQENLTQRNRDGLCGDAHAQRYVQKKRHNSNEFLRTWKITCGDQLGIRIELAVVKKLANAVLVRGRKVYGHKFSSLDLDWTRDEGFAVVSMLLNVWRAADRVQHTNKQDK